MMGRHMFRFRCYFRKEGFLSAIAAIPITMGSIIVLMSTAMDLCFLNRYRLANVCLKACLSKRM